MLLPCTGIIHTMFWKPHTNCVRWICHWGWDSLSNHLKVEWVGGGRGGIMSHVCVTLNPICSLLFSKQYWDSKWSYQGYNEMGKCSETGKIQRKRKMLYSDISRNVVLGHPPQNHPHKCVKNEKSWAFLLRLWSQNPEVWGWKKWGYSSVLNLMEVFSR